MNDNRHGFVLLGVDGSPSSDRAVAWAVGEARRRQLGLQVVGVWRTPVTVAGPASAIAVPTMLRVARNQAERCVEAAAREAVEAGVEATTEVLEGHPADVLLSMAGAADQLVVGDRGASAVARFLLGSTSTAVVHHAVGPVTVVRGDLDRRHRRVVVGIDGSEASRVALRRAAVEAAALGGDLHVVAAWRVVDPDLVGGFSGHRIPAVEELREWAETRAQEVLRTEEAALSGCRARLDVRHDDPAHALLDAARHAGLLVVGSRGLGAWDRMMLGSVSTTCLHHAPCPVQVVAA